MEVRECIADDVISLLHCASNDETVMVGMFDGWANYQKWLLDAVYNKNYQVLVVDDGFGVVGYLIWQMYQTYFKWTAYLHYIYVNKDFRKGEASDKLVIEFIHNAYNSSAQRLKFDTKALPPHWVDVMSANAPLDKYNTYYIERTEESKRFYNDTFRREKV